MIKLKVTPTEALRELNTIDHLTCQRAISKRWVIEQNGDVRPQSILWLFCWAVTGMGSDHAAEAAKKAFNNIFNQSYDWLSRKISHDYARRNRYKKSNITYEFQARLRNSK